MNASRTRNPTKLPRFIRRIFRKMRKFLGIGPADKPIGKLEFATDFATLWHVASDDSGIVDCWQICHEDADFDLVLSLLSIPQLREDIAFKGKHYYQRSTDPIRITGKKPFNAELEEYMQDCGGLDVRQISHIVVVVLRSQTSQRFHAGTSREFRRYLTYPLLAFPCDLVGVSFAWTTGNRYASAIVKGMAKSLLKIKRVKSLSWEDQIRGVDLIDLLERYSNKAFGEGHVLQPRKGC